MAKGHRSQIKRERNEVKDTRPSAKLSYARVSVQKACFVLDAIRGKDVATALAIVTYNPRYASSLVKKLLESAIANAENNNGMKAENLYVAECYADKGPSIPLYFLRIPSLCRYHRFASAECQTVPLYKKKPSGLPHPQDSETGSQNQCADLLPSLFFRHTNIHPDVQEFGSMCFFRSRSFQSGHNAVRLQSRMSFFDTESSAKIVSIIMPRCRPLSIFRPDRR